MACDGVVPMTLGVSSVFTSRSPIHVLLGSFSAQRDPEMAPLATQSVVPGHLLLLLCKPGAGLSGARGSPGVGVCAGAHAPTRMQVCLPTQELSLPCLASGRWDRNVPPAGPSEAPASDCPYHTDCGSGPSLPCRQGLAAFGRLPWWRRTLDYRKCLHHLCRYLSVSIDDPKLLLVIINEYSQDSFPQLSKHYLVLGK